MSQVSSSMNVSNFVVRQSTDDKGILCKRSEMSSQYTAEQTTQNTQGMSLRKWLNCGFNEANKPERLQIYRQIVQVVDMAHSQGNALQDLRLSNFILFPSNEIIYFNSSAQHQVVNFMDQNYRKNIQPGPESYVTVELEKNWYACPEELYGSDLLSANIYSLGILLFELLGSFIAFEMQYAVMSDLRNRILPPSFIYENPQEAGFCLWLLHPNPASRPTTRKILQSELLSGTKDLNSKSTYASTIDKSEDAEFEILHDFLISLKEQKEKHALELRETIQLLETDMKRCQDKKLYRMLYDSNISETDMSQLESAYFSKRARLQPAETVSNERNDLDLLGNRKMCYEKNFGCTNDVLDDICKFMRYRKFKVCGSLKNENLLNSSNAICSLSFDHDENYIAAAGVSNKIKIYEFESLLHDSVDVKYPAVELLNKSEVSCVSWNNYLKNYLASVDYDGAVQVWDAFTGQGLSHYTEHQQRAWCVDFSLVDPTQFASGSDDRSVKLWNLNNKTSNCTIKSAGSVCCVQFSPCSSYLLAFGSADYKIHCYDLRNTRIPWCTLAGHQKAVSHVKFVDSDSLASASTDNTLKLWDLKQTSLEGISTDACCMTYIGHTNEKNFVGLSVLDGYIACGSESNEVYAYHKSFPMPITSYNFGSTDSDETGDGNTQFVSSVCWREISNTIVAGNSGGSIKVLKML
ncbi:suppressor of PHYA-105 1-like protein isoform X1 [Tanacetum coccineum]|uniref:Suppressor of PHYA-105 1-like protein isoform X1 n=1 Tax=Tanacetum coccineum TaxID=301880 RepID=A0ABQ4WDE9_9ASTR